MSKKPLLTLLSSAALSALAALSVPISAGVAAAASASENARAIKGSYIVQLSEMPVVAYTGDIKGYAATKPRAGQKIDPYSSKVVNYKSYLESRHDTVLASVGGKKFYSYGYSFNGFAARLTEAQANALASMKGVVKVTPDAIHLVDTSSTPEFLDMDGLWSKLGGPANAGEGIIIGVVDSGIWPENPSFSDRTGANGNASKDGKLSYQQIPGWHGKCTPGEQFDASLCNQKLIGAQYFNAGQGGSAVLGAERPWEFMSVRDYNGHGTHTASTAGGNAKVNVTGPGAALGSISGMAPRARIAAYKALWSTEDSSTAGGTTSDLVAAIDQAVADGVDVINYSVSGSLTDFLHPAEVAFLFAADAGVFVATSAGNSGPGSSTVAHPGPWVTTVAAGTHNRSGNGSVTLGNGVTYNGASIAQALGPEPFIDSVNAGLPGANATEVALCYSTLDTADHKPVLDPAKVAGKIVLCDRGVTARVNKSLAVQEAGGAGTVLVNVSAGSVNADFHVIPTVHLAHTERDALKAYAATANATAKINDSTIVYDVAAPLTASFSSRGPLLAGGGDLLKPDVIAPGQDILAAYSPALGGLDFNQISGTSMSSPHVAGIAAVLKQLYPGWSPMMIKSALMTTGTDVLDGGTPAPNTNPVLIFRQGAGHVAPPAAAEPGAVYNAGWNDWLAFLCGTTNGVGAATCNALVGLGYSTDPSNLNVASIAIGDMAGVQTVKRSLTNVSGKSLTLSATLTGMAGFSVVIAPSTLVLGPGQTKSFEVTFTRTSATLNAYTGGQLTWAGDKYTVRSPIVVRPVALAAPASVASTGAAVSYNVKFGYDGAFTATPRGLVLPATTDGTVADDPTDSTCSLTSPNAQKIDVAVPAGTTYARFALFDADVAPGSDIDLCVFNGTTLVGTSGSGTSAETVNLVNPAAATYTVVVQGWGVAGSSPFKLHTWLLSSAAAGNMTVTAPASATTGGTGTITVTPAADLPSGKWLGSVAYGGIAGLPNPTIVTVFK